MHSKQQIERYGRFKPIKIGLGQKEKDQQWLAEQLGVNQATVSKWCTNTTQPDLMTLKKISELLDVSASEIINFD